MNFRLKYKKANAFMDIMMIVLVLLGMAILGLVANNMFKELNDDIQADPDIGANVKTQTQTLKDGFPTWMDNAFLLATVLLWLFLIISSFVIDTHPAFFVVSLILLIFAFGVTMMLSNTFEELTEDDEYATGETDFPITFWIMDNLLLLIIIMGGSILVTLYGKNKFVG